MSSRSIRFASWVALALVAGCHSAPPRPAPKPAQAPWPPLHIGGDGPAALRRAATVGDGWIPMNHTVEQIAADARRNAQRRDAAGRPGAFEITLAGGDHGADELRRWADLGIGRALVKPWESTKGALDGLRRFADEVLDDVRHHPVRLPQP